MSITIIAAVSENGVIGDSKTGKMPWHVPAELRFFKSKTVGKRIVMGRKTAESVGALPDRECILLTRDQKTRVNGFKSKTIGNVIAESAFVASIDTIICGGAEMYSQFMPYASEMLISRMPFCVDGDVMMPKIDSDIWELEVSAKFDEFSVDKYVRRA